MNDKPLPAWEQIERQLNSIKTRIQIVEANFAKHDGNWYAPSMLGKARAAEESLRRSKHRLDKIPVLWKHGARKQAFRELVQARKLLKDAEHNHRYAERTENTYRERITSSVHNS